jgi:hypothetical protein
MAFAYRTMDLPYELHKILACAHPLMLSNPDEEYPFFSGTCFSVRYRRKLFVLSALHCFNGLDVKRTRVDCGLPHNEFFPLKRWSRFDAADLPDPDVGDIALFEVDTERMTNAEVGWAPSLEVADNLIGAPELPSGCQLILEGYPYEPVHYSPDLRMTVRPSRKLTAIYEGPTGQPGISGLSFKDLGDLGDLNGMSGSPVLGLRRSSADVVKYRLAGMLIRASTAQKRGSFINADVLMVALKQCADG